MLQDDLEKALQAMWERWQKQNDSFDWITKYIYTAETFEDFIEKTNECTKNHPDIDGRKLFAYAINRWYNFKISDYAESVFLERDITKDEPDKKHREIDFYIKDIPFDLKMSVFPKRYTKDINYAMEHKEDLIHRMYKNCSQEQRLHNWNKLFIVCYSTDWNHNKVKWDLNSIREAVNKYMENYDEWNLYIEDNSLSDIIFIIK